MEKVKLNRYFISDIFFYQEGPGVRKWQFKDSGVKLINVGNINNGKIDLSSTKINISEEEAYGKYSHFLIDEGDLLIACSGIVVENFHNKIAFIKKEHLPLCLNTSTMRFKELPEKKGDLNFLKYFLQTNDFKSQLRKLITGSAQLNFGPSHIRKIEIPLPNLATQQRIAAILDQADAIIQNNRAIVQKYDALTQSLFLEMFGDPVKNEKEWKLDKLSIVAPFKKFDGKIKKINGNYWLLNLDMIEQQTGNVIEKKYVSANEINTSTISFSENQVLYSKLRPYLNKVLIPDESGYGTSELVPMNPKGGVIDKFFLAHLLRTNNFVNYINDKVAGAKMPRVNMDTLRDFQIILPPIQLQNQFAERVLMIEAPKKQAQLELAKSEELFQSLLQRAFKGELS